MPNLRDYSDLMIVRVMRTGLFRRLSILVAFNDMLRLFTCTRTVFEQVSPTSVAPMRCIGITLLESDRR